MNTEAGDGARTHDPQLGKLMLYQLSYAREAFTLAVSAASLRAFRLQQLLYVCKAAPHCREPATG